jgi:hypothetical protein
MALRELKLIYWITLIQISVIFSSSQDNLCFLSHGGSSETFTVNEALPVNSVIGSIRVIMFINLIVFYLLQ